jgi:hypothetical protein
MIIKIPGRKYNFEIVSKNGGQNVCFYIKSICKSTKRTSCINNLNAILSELDVDHTKPKFFDSMWVVSRKEASHFVNTAKSILADPIFLNYLEKRLDEGRFEGEWENISTR